MIYAYDIEDALNKELESKIKINNITNVIPFTRDFISSGTDLQNEEVDYVMLFNILHADESIDILKETFRILKKKGRVGVIHWNYDPSTPRGPSAGQMITAGAGKLSIEDRPRLQVAFLRGS